MLRKEAKTLLEPLAKTHDLRFVAFDRDVSTIGADPAKPEVPEADGPASSSTRIGDAIARVIDDAGDRPIAGILLLSDGRNTAGASPAEAARLASNDSAPVFPVTLGGSVRMKDVAIVDVFAPNIVSVGDTVKVAVTIESSGFDGRATKVDLKTDSVIDSKEIVLRGAEQQVVELTFAATKPGSFALTVEVPPQPEEAEVLLQQLGRGVREGHRRKNQGAPDRRLAPLGFPVPEERDEARPRPRRREGVGRAGRPRPLRDGRGRDRAVVARGPGRL